MKNKFTYTTAYISLVFLIFLANSLKAQCVNADFSDGNFTGWTGTYFNVCTSSLLGFCQCSATDPLYTTGFNQGPNNSALNNDSVQYNQVITTAAAGNDSNLALYGILLPVAWPGGSSYAARLGSMWQAVEPNGSIGDGETMSYTFMVTPANCNFTYHYAVVLDDGGHAEDQQAYFSVKMLDGSNNEITCAGYNVNATSCHAIGGGGFTHVLASADLFYKPWSSVLVPLASYIGQTVTITFTNRGCVPLGCAGTHYGYAYFSCECASLDLLHLTLTRGGHCGSPEPTITAPAGFNTYTWTGPGVLGLGNTQTISIYQPGRYMVTMTSSGTLPCTYTLDTLVPNSLGFFVANFTASTGCLDSTVTFTDRSALHDSITSWAWDFNNDGITDASTENPNYIFPGTGTYPVKLTISSATCITDTVINITVVKQPVVTLTAGPPECAALYASILYSVNDSNAYNFTYNWNFDSANVINDTGFGGYLVGWYATGTKNITLTVIDSNCVSLPVSVQQVVNPIPYLVLPADTGFCMGDSITLTASGATTYAWMADSTLSDTSTATVVATPNTVTTYIVTGVLNGCQSTNYITVTPIVIPTLTLSALTDTVCGNGTLTLSYSPQASDSAVYTWNFDGGTGVLNVNTVLVTWPSAGTETITASVNNNGCVATDTIAVYVSAQQGPVLTLTSDTGICLGSSVILTAGGAGIYTWAADSTLSATNTPSVIVTPDSTDTYYVTGFLNGCTAIDSVTVQAVAIPVVSLYTVDSVCANNTVQITDTGNAPGNAVYTWNFDGGIVASGVGSGPYLLSWPTAGTKNVSLTVAVGGCSSPVSTIPVIVKDVPTLTIFGDSTVCIGNQLTLTATGAQAYAWTIDSLIFTNNSVTILFDSISTSLYVTGTTNGCSTTDSVSIISTPLPIVSFITSGQVCVGDTLTLTFTGSALAGANYNWNFGYGNANTLTGSGPVQVSWDSAGFSPVSLTVLQDGCTATFADTVPVQICSGIEQINSSQINIYPNPAKNDFTVEVTGAINNGQLEIYDVLGQVLHTEELNGTTGLTKQIHVAVAAGVYFVSVREGDKYYTQKLIIE